MTELGSSCGIKEVDIAISYAIEEKNDTFQDLMTRLTALTSSLYPCHEMALLKISGFGIEKW